MINVVVRVKPGSKKGPTIDRESDGSLTVYVRERAIGGKANAAVALLLARHFGVAKSRVTVARGRTARIKTVIIA